MEESRGPLRELDSHLLEDGIERDVYTLARDLVRYFRSAFHRFNIKGLIHYLRDYPCAFSDSETDLIKSKLADALISPTPVLTFSRSFATTPLNSKGESAVAYAEVLKDVVGPLQNTLMNRRMWTDDIVI